MCFSVDVMCYYDWCNMNNVEKYTKQKCKLICWQVLETTNGDVTVHFTFNWNKCAVIDWQCAHNQEWVLEPTVQHSLCFLLIHYYNHAL